MQKPLWLLLFSVLEAVMLKPDSVIAATATGTPDCSRFTKEDLPYPRILLLGPTGVGKSTLANQLLGRDPRGSETLFSVGDTADSHTLEISYRVGNWLGSGECFTIIDTPGTSDTKGRDYKHAIEMAHILKNDIKSVNVFLLLFNGQNPRFQASLIQLLKLYESIFSRDMWKHSITEVTFWQHHKRAVKDRRRNSNMTELYRHNLWNQQYKEALNIPVREIPSVYIDPVYPIFSKDPDDIADIKEDPKEMSQFKHYTAKLWEYATSFPPFFCDDKCKAPDGFFIGAPWMKTGQLTARKGDKVSLICQIWNGLEGEASDNVTFVHNGKTVYEKKTIPGPGTGKVKTSYTDKWEKTVKFEEKRAPGVGYFSDFEMNIDSFDPNMVGKLSCNNSVPSTNNVANLLLKVDGKLSNWGSWSQCSKSCVGEDKVPGRKTRTRKCIPPQNGGNPCKGELVDTEVCAGDGRSSTLQLCPVNHVIGAWSKWSECTPKCGDGSKFRMRTCTPGRNGGTACPSHMKNLAEEEVLACKVKDCPECISKEWNEWSQCSKTCTDSVGAGVRARTRNTREADPNNPKCNPEDHQATEYCSMNACPTDGKMSQWTSWAPSDNICAKSCVDATRTSVQTRYRQCVEPNNGGAPCQFNAQTSETRNCPGSKPCPIDCVWNQWGEWEECSEACGPGGKKKRRRSKKEFKSGVCIVGPCYGGKECEGFPIEESDCFERLCPSCVRGEWSEWGSCQQACTDAKRKRTRGWVEPPDADQFTGLNLNCKAQDPSHEFEDCDGLQAIADAHGAPLWMVESRCDGFDPEETTPIPEETTPIPEKPLPNPMPNPIPKPPGNDGDDCFAKNSIVITETGPLVIQSLVLGQRVLTLHDNQTLLTPFLGWIHRETETQTKFFTLETQSQKIVLSAKHVIFIKTNQDQPEPVTTFADMVKLGDLLHILENNTIRWEEVVRIKTDTRTGIYAPLTSSGTILVDNVLASCYADFLNQGVADTSFLPIKLFPWILDDQESQHKDGLRTYPHILMRLGNTLNVLEHGNTEEAKQPAIYSTLVLLVFVFGK